MPANSDASKRGSARSASTLTGLLGSGGGSSTGGGNDAGVRANRALHRARGDAEGVGHLGDRLSECTSARGLGGGLGD
jgi:hypothetical protein